MAALLEDATRQPRAAWPLRYSALATDQSYRLTKTESGDVGCAAIRTKRHSAGNAPGMTALLEVTLKHRAPKVRHCLPPSRWLIKPLRSTFYMPNRPLALVERAQAAIKREATTRMIHLNPIHFAGRHLPRTGTFGNLQTSSESEPFRPNLLPHLQSRCCI